MIRVPPAVPSLSRLWMYSTAENLEQARVEGLKVSKTIKKKEERGIFTPWAVRKGERWSSRRRSTNEVIRPAAAPPWSRAPGAKRQSARQVPK